MDPLSIAASVVALVQAVKGITKMAKYVGSLSNPTLEIYRLQNEVWFRLLIHGKADGYDPYDTTATPC